MSTSERPHRFRLAYVPGATPAKWVRIWRERLPDVDLVLDAVAVADTANAIAVGSHDIAITRLPDALTHANPGPHHTISLYDETTVVVVPQDHVVTAAEALTFDDLADEPFLWPLDEPLIVTDRPGVAVEHRPATTSDAIELVAAGMGLLLVPQSLARLHHRKDLVYRPVTDAPASTVGLLWRDPTPQLCEEFIGIVRGRTASSSRGAPEHVKKRSAKEKAAAKRANREAAGKKPGSRTRRRGPSR